MKAGARRWIQTTDIRPRKPALYPLSYPRMLLWLSKVGSNHRTPAYEAGALPLSYWTETELMADPAGLEPATPGIKVRCSTN